jgi:hypothetical protein
MAIRYSVPLEYLVYSNSNSNFEYKGKIKTIAVTYLKVASLSKYFTNF